MRNRKRRAWWIAGAFVALTIAVAAAASSVAAGEERTEEALGELVLEYGFRAIPLPYDPAWSTHYKAPMMNEQQGEDVLRKLEEICSGWEVDVIDAPEFREGVAPIYSFRTRPRGRRISDVMLTRDSRTPSAIAHGVSPKMTLLMMRAREGPGVLDRLKDLWPW